MDEEPISAAACATKPQTWGPLKSFCRSPKDQGGRCQGAAPNGTHGCGGGHQVPGAQRLLLCQQGGPSLAEVIFFLPAGSLGWAPFSSCHRATKPGCDTGDKSIRSAFLPVGHPQGALHRRGCHRRLTSAPWFSSPGWFGSRSHQRRGQDHPLYLPEQIRACLLQPAEWQLSCRGGTGKRSLLCLLTAFGSTSWG